MGWRVAALLLCLAAGARAAEAEADPDERARVLYQQGKQAYDSQRYAEAHEAFKAAYLISQRPELLFNMARALEQLDRPHDAAETLRAFLRVRPDDSDRDRIEEHIRALEEKQRLVDAERARQAPPSPVALAPAIAPPPPRPPPPHRRWWPWTLLGVGLAGVAVGTGVGVWRATTPSYPATSPTDGKFHF
jgi:tetratricopeptide (TPR) repeat protein